MNFELMKQKRKEKGLTQQQLADLCGLSKTTIFNYENRVSEPTKDNLEKLAKELDLSVVELAINKDDFIIENLGDLLDDTEYLLEEYINDFQKFIVYSYVERQEFSNYSEKKLLFIVKKSLSLFNELTGFKVFYSYLLEKVIFIDEENNIMKKGDLSCFLSIIKNLVSVVSNFTYDIDKSSRNDLTSNSYWSIVNLVKAEESFFIPTDLDDEEGE